MGACCAANSGPPSMNWPGRQAGFTLIELMIVVFIIAILVAIAIPSYLRYASRAQISESFTQATPVRRLVEEYYFVAGAFPPDRESAGIDPPGEYAGAYVKEISIQADGVVAVLFGPSAVEGNTLLFTPTPTGTGLDWTCSSPDIRPSLLPSECQ